MGHELLGPPAEAVFRFAHNRAARPTAAYGCPMTDTVRTSSLRERRFAANQTVFRRSNERLSRQGGDSGAGPTLYVCECGDDSCGDLVSLLASEYEHVRSSAAWFLIALDHEILPGALERILETHARHHVVEKSGAAGTLAKSLDTRRDRSRVG